MDQAADSISDWLGRLKAGEAEAAQKLWHSYFEALLRVAKQRLGKSPCGIADEEDVALSAFGSILHGAAAGRFDKVSTRDELWWLLLTITKRKAVDHIRREAAQKRNGKSGPYGNQRVNGTAASWPVSLNDLVSASPTPDFLITLEEQYARLLKSLRNAQMREIALLRIEGYSIAEIAEKMKVSLRAIDRKLHSIRKKWKRELLETDRVQ